MSLRYEKADNLLQLALEMQAARRGLSLQDIQERFAVGRRTAMRMRDAILRNFPQAVEVDTDDKSKRWRIPSGVLDRMVSFSADELADLESTIALVRANGQPDRAARLENMRGKLKALIPPDVARRTEPDIDALLEAEGFAMRPGPRPRVPGTVMVELRDAVKACLKAEIDYRNRRNGKLNTRLVHPYGFLFGHRNYLVAYHEHPKANDVALFSLSNIEGVKLLDDYFIRKPEFRLADFAARSFGVYQQDPYEVIWKFVPEAASTAAEFEFHPTQQLEPQEDGSLIVRFWAASDLEMAWHLYMWGDKVEVIAPQSLKEMVADNRPSWPALP
ncbi:MAG: WYL domain-containing protein [Rhodospirillales bacterium]|nr:WYL domain-containing protein [Rhodospirillales bacterium]MBO6785732.1 WYL domain-containing protein [Rhodospirillales bacterium]